MHGVDHLQSNTEHFDVHIHYKYKLYVHDVCVRICLLRILALHINRNPEVYKLYLKVGEFPRFVSPFLFYGAIRLPF